MVTKTESRLTEEYDSESIPPRAASIASKSSRKKRNRKKRARQWTYYIDTLKRTIDDMYELCRAEHSVAGCREAMLYLQNANNDFKSLIESINVEVEWATQPSEQRHSVAWEVRKSMSSPNHHAIIEKSNANNQLLPISSMIAEVVRNAAPSDSITPPNMPSSMTYARITAAAAAVVAVAAEQQFNESGDGWQVVRGRRRKSASSTTASEFDREMSIESDQAPSVPQNVYERLSSGVPSCRRGHAPTTTSSRRLMLESNVNSSQQRLTCPKSAMDLPQTKASMAKMAYCRQLLWERNHRSLVEKLRLKNRKDKLIAAQSSASLTNVDQASAQRSRTSTCGFTFADPLAVRKSAEAYSLQKRQKMHQKQQISTGQATVELDRSLQSINEGAEEEANLPCSPMRSRNVMTSSSTSDDVPADPKPKSPPPSTSSPAKSNPKQIDGARGSERRGSRSEPVNEPRPPPMPSTSSVPSDVPSVISATPSEVLTTMSAPPTTSFDLAVAALGGEDAVAWREMTEEEESLALEENSLKFEIEKAESVSIDAELERQVAVEAEKIERANRREKHKRHQKREDTSGRTLTGNLIPPSDSASEADYQRFYKAFKEELHTLATVAWSELMNCQSSVGPVHEPGTSVEKHEKMSSPSRRKCEKDDDDFGRRHEEKLRRAEELRLQLQEEKAAKVKELTKRVEEVRAKQEALKERKRRLLEDKMQRAIENRDKNITEIIRKAKDDDQKVLEVQFINTLQEDNKRHDLMMKDACLEEKKKQLADERARKMEEKAAKEAAAVSRRKKVQMDRQKRLQEMAEKKDARLSQRAADQERKRRESRMQTAKKAEKVENVEADFAIKSTPDVVYEEKRDQNDALKTKSEVDEHEEIFAHLWQVVSGVTVVDKKNLTVEKANSDDRWSFLSNADQWPSTEETEKPKLCTVCNVQLLTCVDSTAHIFSREHVAKTHLFEVDCSARELKKHDNMLIDVENRGIANTKKDGSDRKSEELALEKLTKIAIRDPIPLPLSSPRTRSRQIRELISIMDKVFNANVIEEGLQKSMETTLADLVQAFENEEKTEQCLTVEQICAVGGINRICDLLMDWTKKGASLRLCIRYSHALCVFLRDPRAAYSVLFKHQMQRIVELLVQLLKNDPTNPQLSSLLDVTIAVMTNAASRISKKSLVDAQSRRFKELQSLDDRLPDVFDAISGYIRYSLSTTSLRDAICSSNGVVALVSRLNSLFATLLPSTIGRQIYSSYVDVIVSHAYNLRRDVAKCRSEGTESNEQTVVRREKIAFDLCGLSLKSLMILNEKNDEEKQAVLKVILHDASRALSVSLIVSDVLRRSIADFVSNLSKKLDNFGKNNDLLRLIDFVTLFASGGAHLQLLCLIGSPSDSILSLLASLPLRCHIVSPFSDHLMPALVAICGPLGNMPILAKKHLPMIMDPSLLTDFMEKKKPSEHAKKPVKE